MTPPTKALWRRIISSKPHDWFDPGSLVLLAQYCELAVQTELLVERRRAMDLPAPGDDLQGSDRLDRVRTPDRLHARFRKAEVPDLTFLDQVPHRAGDILDRHVRVDAMLIEEIDNVLIRCKALDKPGASACDGLDHKPDRSG